MACQTYLYERYLQSLGASGREARALLTNRTVEERQLEALFNAPAIAARKRSPAPPLDQ